MIEWQASRTRLPRSNLRAVPDLRDRLALSRFDVGYAVLFGAGTFLTTMLWFSDGGTWSARFGDGMGTAAMWLIAAVVMWLSKAIPFFHRHETVRWLVIGTPALIAAAVLLALSGGNTGQ